MESDLEKAQKALTQANQQVAISNERSEALEKEQENLPLEFKKDGRTPCDKIKYRKHAFEIAASKHFRQEGSYFHVMNRRLLPTKPSGRKETDIYNTILQEMGYSV